MTPARLFFRWLGTDRGRSALVVLVVAVAAAIGSIGPAALQAAQSASLRYALSATDSALRDVSVVARGALQSGPGSSPATAGVGELATVWGRGLDSLNEISGAMAPELARTVEAPRIATVLDPVSASPVDPESIRPLTEVSVAMDPLLGERVDYVEGTAPAPFEADRDAPIDMVMTAPVAESMGWTVGEVRVLGYGELGTRTVRLAGIFEAVDPADPAWRHFPTSQQPTVIDGGLGPPTFQGVGFLDPASLDGLEPLARFASVLCWFPLDVDSVDGRQREQLSAAIRSFAATPATIPVITDSRFDDDVTAVDARITFLSTVPHTIASAAALASTVDALVSLLVAGPAVLAAVVLVLACRLLASRRRAWLQLAEARGASRPLLAGSLALEGAALGLAGALLGIIVGLVGGAGLGALPIPLLLAVVPVVALPLFGLVTRAGRDDLDASASRMRQLIELAVLVAATIAIVLILARDRGEGRVDPVLSAVPLLAAGVACVLALRAIPLILRAVARAVPRTLGALALLGWARSLRAPTVRTAPVLAIVIGVAVAVFGTGMLTTLTTGIDAAARQDAGSDLTVRALYINQKQLDQISAVPGIEAMAPVYADERAEVALPDGDADVMIYVIDVAEVRRVQSDVADALPLPDELLDADRDVVPVVASEALASRLDGAPVAVRGAAVEIVAEAPSDTPLGSAELWIAVDRSVADRIVALSFSPSSVLLALDPGIDVQEVRASVAAIIGESVVFAQPEQIAGDRRADPAYGAVAGTLAVVISIAGLLLALTVILTLVLAAGQRARLFALLGALGMGRASRAALVAWEVVPSILVAVPIAVLTGLVLVPLVLAGVDLTPFTGGSAQPVILIAAPWVALIVAGFLVVLAVAVLVSILVAGRTQLAATTRTVDSEG